MSFLLAAWTFVASPVGRLVAVGGMSLLLGFSQGWAIKARMDRSATLQAVVAKQRIDLKAAQDAADQASAVATDIAARDAANQEVIRDLQIKLAQRPAGDRCTLDPVAADGLRRLR
jgi:hypothetical protein